MGCVSGKWNTTMGLCATLLLLHAVVPVPMASAQALLFDFDNAPLQSSLPIDQTVGGITAHFAATGQGYSIQNANVMGFVPQGFAGRMIYPNSVFLADLLVSFDQAITDFSIMYACQELGCDDAATMRVTAYMGGSLVGSSTRTATYPGTWPSDTLRCVFAQGFDSVVVHYDSHPPTCQDYGVIYLADNMRVTALNTTGIADPGLFIEGLIVPNPISRSSIISFSLLQGGSVRVTVQDLAGRSVKELWRGPLSVGQHQFQWDVDAVDDGVYVVNITGEHFSRSRRLLVVK